MAQTAAVELLLRAQQEMGIALPRTSPPTVGVPLPSRLATAELAWASVAAAALAGGVRARDLDPARIAAVFRSDLVLSIDDAAPPIWSPASGFWRTRDGFIRTHANYPHHRRALCSALSVSDVDSRAVGPAVGDALAHLDSDAAIAAITAAGGLAVHVRPEDPASDARLRGAPLLDISHDGTSGVEAMLAPNRDPLPLSGIRVLDLTRVIAGPVCARTLALMGADVLRIDPPHVPELPWQHLDTGHGKRSAVLDARSAQMQGLLDEADVVILGYRPAALARLGLTREDLHDKHPRLVVAELSAWGADHPDRAGFDSLVQAESGIALIESADGDTPGALPAQALDHSAGYLLAAGVAALLRHRDVADGSWSVRTSLRRIAAELLGMPRTAEPEPEMPIDLAAHSAHFDVAGRDVVTAASVLPGVDLAAPREWGGDQPSW